MIILGHADAYATGKAEKIGTRLCRGALRSRPDYIPKKTGFHRDQALSILCPNRGC